MFTRSASVVVVLSAAVALICAAVARAADASPSWKGPFFFVLLTDPQLGMFAADKDFVRESALMEKAVDHVNRLKPAFVVFCGDHTNKVADPAQIGEFKRLVAKIDKSIPVYLVAGNHDVGNAPTAKDLDLYRREFGRDWYSFDYGGCHFVVLNSVIIHKGEKVADQAAAQMAWLAEDLRQAASRKPKHVIVFQHHTLFVSRIDEPASYHSIPPDARKTLIDLYAASGVSAVFAGHLHYCAAPRFDRFIVFAAGPVGKPLGKDPSGLTIVAVRENKVEYRYFGLDNVPARAE